MIRNFIILTTGVLLVLGSTVSAEDPYRLWWEETVEFEGLGGDANLLALAVDHEFNIYTVGSRNVSQVSGEHYGLMPFMQKFDSLGAAVGDPWTFTSDDTPPVSGAVQNHHASNRDPGIHDIAIDEDNNIYLAGSATWVWIYPGSNELDNERTLLAKLNPNGTEEWVTEDTSTTVADGFPQVARNVELEGEEAYVLLNFSAIGPSTLARFSAEDGSLGDDYIVYDVEASHYLRDIYIANTIAGTKGYVIGAHVDPDDAGATTPHFYDVLSDPENFENLDRYELNDIDDPASRTVAVDSEGYVYVGGPEGVTKGSVTGGTTFTEVDYANANISDILIDSSDNLFVAGFSPTGIRKFDSELNDVWEGQTISLSGISAYAVDDLGNIYTIQKLSGSVKIRKYLTWEFSLADFNLDGYVDGADFSFFLSQWGSVGGKGPADFNKDNTVDGGDTSFFLGEWDPPPSPGLSSVPEPASVVLLGLGGVMVVRRRRN